MSFSKTKLYFDTKFLLSALGHEGDSLKAPNIEVLRLARSASADTCCFVHTVDEVRSILNGCSRMLTTAASAPGYGPVYDHFHAVSASVSDVILAANRVEDDLRGLKIQIVTPPQGEYEHVVDERKLEETIRAKVNYVNLNALIRDIASIAAVVKLRGDANPRYLETAIAVFVTPNRPLVQAVREFFHTEVEDDQVAVAITDGDLTNILWLKRPLVAPELPRRRLIATCYAALQPSDEFRRRYLAEIEKLQKAATFSERDVFMLRHSIEARRIALDLTVGDESAFTMGTVTEVLQVLQRELQQEALSKADEERAKALSADARAEDLVRTLDREHEIALERQTRRETRVQQIARTLAWALAIVFGALLAVGVYFSIPEVPVPWRIPRWSRLTASALAAFLTVLTALAPVTVLETLRAKVQSLLVAPSRRMSHWFSGE